MTSGAWKAPRDETYADFRELRVAAGMMLWEVAKALHVDDSMVSLWEGGRRPLPLVRVPAIAQLFGITVDEARARLRCSNPAEPVPPPKPARASKPIAVKATPIADPADETAWARPDPESRDATQRYEIYALQDAEAQQCAQSFRRTMGRTQYFPAYESVLMGPSVRCRRGHLYCRSDHAHETRAARRSA